MIKTKHEELIYKKMVTTYLLIWLWNGIKYCHRCMVSWLLLSQQACWRIFFVVLKKKGDLVKSCLKCKTLLVYMPQTHWSSQAPKHFQSCTGKNERLKIHCSGNTYFLLFIGSNRCDISCEAAVATAVDFLVIKASGVKAHSLLSLLYQSGLFTLNLKDLSLDV